MTLGHLNEPIDLQKQRINMDNIQWDVENPHVLEIPVLAEHIDVLGHANNCEYLKWMEQVAWDHCVHLGMDWNTWQELGFAWVARHTEIDYFLPAFESDSVLAGTWVMENDKKISMVRGYQLVSKKTGKTLIRGHTKWVCINLETQKASRMPQAFVDAFAKNEAMA